MFLGTLNYGRLCKNGEKSKVIIGIIGIVCVLLFIGIIVWCIIPRKIPAKIIDSRWTWTSDLQQKTKYRAEEWGKPWGKDVVPGSLHCKSKYYGQRRCNCYTTRTCSGSGDHKSCSSHEHCSSCPEYRDWCVYDYWLWPVIQTKTNTGDCLKNPVWPELIANGPDQRIAQHEKYEVTFKPEEHDTCVYKAKSLNDLRQYVESNWWQIKVNKFSLCEPVKLLTGETE